jgi:hypothetical protein
LRFEKKLYETKLQGQSEQSTKVSAKLMSGVGQEVAAKLPKLVI